MSNLFRLYGLHVSNKLRFLRDSCVDSGQPAKCCNNGQEIIDECQRCDNPSCLGKPWCSAWGLYENLESDMPEETAPLATEEIAA